MARRPPEIAVLERWLLARGGEKRPLCDYEIMRVKTCMGKALAWENRKGRVRLNDVAERLQAAMQRGEKPDLQRGSGEPDRAFTLDDTDRLLAFVYERERVTVADVCAQVRTDSGKVARRMIELKHAGRLVTSGGGPGDALWFGCA